MREYIAGKGVDGEFVEALCHYGACSCAPRIDPSYFPLCSAGRA